jgi:hypothetical protein
MFGVAPAQCVLSEGRVHICIIVCLLSTGDRWFGGVFMFVRLFVNSFDVFDG